LAAVGAEAAKTLSTLSGTGSLSAVGRVLKPTSVSFVGAGAVTPTARELARGAVAFSGAGTFTPTARELAQASVGFVGSGSLAAVGLRLARGAVAFAGSGTYAPIGGAPGVGTATFHGSGSLVPSARTTVSGAVAFSGSGVLGGAGASVGGQSDVPVFVPPRIPDHLLQEPVYATVASSQGQWTRARLKAWVDLLVASRQAGEQTDAACSVEMKPLQNSAQAQVHRGITSTRGVAKAFGRQPGQWTKADTNAWILVAVKSTLEPPEVPSYDPPDWQRDDMPEEETT
jgi:hypothetical protein